MTPPSELTLPLQEPIATVALQGYEIGPEIWLNPVVLDFGPLDVGDEKELTFTIDNQGDAELVIAAVEKGETDFEIFDAISVVPAVPVGSVVAPDSTTGLTVTVRFSPTKNYPTYSCTSDLQCPSPFACVPSVLDPGAFLCAGPNWEFSRPNAALELVFFSVSEDGSPDAVADYVDFFKSLKGAANPGLVRAHAVVGDSGGGCKGPTGLAFAGDRYGEVASALGGKRHSICQPTWASVLEDAPGDTSGLVTTVALSRPPLPASITVTVDGAACQSGWAYDAAANAIHVDPAGACMPTAGETVAVSYDTVCFPD